jgi:ABC-type dipeptide/oligopeptide/nickel transport system ATPase component
LQISDLAVSFDSRDGSRMRAVDGVSLTVHPGQTLAVVGESGCGKSVTALSVLQLLASPPARYDRGSILLENRNLLELSRKQMGSVRGGHIAMIFQEPMTSLNPVFTVGRQIIEAVQLHRKVGRWKARQMAIESMQAVGIADAQQRFGSYPHEFSGGMRQRVMIAMALACNPKVLLADEPTTALDVTIQAQILDLLARLKRERGLAIMLITHDLGIVAQHADVVCVMYAGRVVEYAKVFDLFESPLHPYTRGLLACRPRIGERAERLRTVSEIVENPLEFQRLPGAKRGVIPWWPRHEPPRGVRADAAGGSSALIEVEPEHWVACWRTEAVMAGLNRRPNLIYRRYAVIENAGVA